MISIDTRQTDKKKSFISTQYEILPLTFSIIPLNNVLLPPTERRIKPRCCCCCVDEIERLNKFCIRLSAETDPESEEDEKNVTNSH